MKLLLKFTCVMFCFLLLDFSFAQTSTTPSGSGTQSDPYQVATLNNLYWLSQTSAAWASGKYIMMTADIDAVSTKTWFTDGSGGYYGFPCIGGTQTVGNQISATFSANFDGNGFAIDSLYINRPNDRIGLFGNVGTATIKNLTLTDMTMICSSSSSYVGVGMLMGYCHGVTIDNIHIKGGSVSNDNTTSSGNTGPIAGYTGTITATNCSSSASVSSNKNNNGGFIGVRAGGTGNFTNCYATGNVTSTSHRNAGFVSENTNSGSTNFTNCYATGDVSGTSLNGGFIGIIIYDLTFKNCFATGDVTSSSGDAGGFFGWTWNSSSVANSAFTDCYATGTVSGSTKGGFGSKTHGYSGITFSNCFWDNQNSGLTDALSGSTPSGITGKTTADMKTESTFTTGGWDFVGETTNGSSDDWYVSGSVNSGYPSLVGNVRTWIGTTSTDPTVTTNWENGFLPSSNSIVLISSSASNAPTLTANMSVESFDLSSTSNVLTLGSYNLTCSQVLGGSSTSYIKTNGSGVLSIDLPDGDVVEFPVGRSKYNPMKITNNTGSSQTFTLNVIDVVYDLGTSGTAYNSSQPHIGRTWNITGSVGAGNVDLEFFWNSGENVGSITSTRMYHFSNFEWSNEGAATSSTATSFKFDGYTGSFSPFSIGDNISPLPVKLLNFTASRMKHDILLDWSTATEIDNSHFGIERSYNGHDFQEIGQVDGNGTTNEMVDYQFLDHSVDLNAQTVYYRLRQVDLDGQFEYSPIRKIKSDDESNVNRDVVFPNPTKDVLYVKFTQNEAEKHHVIVRNTMGHIVSTLNTTENIQAIDLSKVSAGLYFVTIDSVTTYKVIKKDYH